MVRSLDYIVPTTFFAPNGLIEAVSRIEITFGYPNGTDGTVVGEIGVKKVAVAVCDKKGTL